MDGKRKVLFLCTGNSARSQMAEALVNDRLGETWEAFSAGTQPAGHVHPAALAALAELDIEHHGFSKSMSHFAGQSFDLVISVCDAAAENCPFWPYGGQRLHIGFPDPAKAPGPLEEQLPVFRAVRDAILDEVLPVLEAFASAGPQPAEVQRYTYTAHDYVK